MSYLFWGEFSAPPKDKVRYDAESGRLYTVWADGREAQGDLFAVVSSSPGFKVLFKADGGSLAGVECGGLNLAALPKARMDVPACADGVIRAEKRGCAFIAGCNYHGLISSAAAYDGEKNLLRFGNANADGMTFRALANAYVTLSPDGKLSAVTVQLKND